MFYISSERKDTVGHNRSQHATFDMFFFFKLSNCIVFINCLCSGKSALVAILVEKQCKVILVNKVSVPSRYEKQQQSKVIRSLCLQFIVLQHLSAASGKQFLD